MIPWNLNVRGVWRFQARHSCLTTGLGMAPWPRSCPSPISPLPCQFHGRGNKPTLGMCYKSEINNSSDGPGLLRLRSPNLSAHPQFVARQLHLRGEAYCLLPATGTPEPSPRAGYFCTSAAASHPPPSAFTRVAAATSRRPRMPTAVRSLLSWVVCTVTTLM